MKQLIKQNDIRMNKKIQKYGCRFRCLLAIVEVTKNRAFLVDEILGLYNDIVRLKNRDVMNDNCMCGIDEHEILNMAFKKMGEKRSNARQIGSMQDGVPKSWAGNKIPYDFMIVHWDSDTQDGHFTLFDNTGDQVYDPWNHNLHPMKLEVRKRELLYRVTRHTTLEGLTTNYKIFKGEKCYENKS